MTLVIVGAVLAVCWIIYLVRWQRSGWQLRSDKTMPKWAVVVLVAGLALMAIGAIGILQS